MRGQVRAHETAECLPPSGRLRKGVKRGHIRSAWRNQLTRCRAGGA